MVAPKNCRKDDAVVAATLRRLFPGGNRQFHLSKAFGRSDTSIGLIMVGRSVPNDVRLIIGLLAACPVEHWPPRWREARDQIMQTKTRRPDKQETA